MIPAIKKAISPSSMSGNSQDDGASVAESFADTYFREIGFKTGDNSLLGSTESPDLDGDELLDDAERSLGLLEDNSLATDVELAVAAAGAISPPNRLSEATQKHRNGPLPKQIGGPPKKSSKSDKSGGVTNKLKSYATPFHSYFGQLLQDSGKTSSDPYPEPHPDPLRNYGKSNRAYAISLLSRSMDDNSISTLGDESLLRKISPINAQHHAPQKKIQLPKQVPAVRSKQGKPPIKAPSSVPASMEPKDLKEARTRSTLEELPSTDSEESPKSSSRKSDGGSTGSSKDDEEAELRWRAIYMLIGVALILLAASGAVLSVCIIQLKQQSDSDSSGASAPSTANTWPPALSSEWVNSPTDSPVATAAPTETFIDPVELARSDLLRIITSLSPDSISEIGTIDSPQYEAFEWVANDPDYMNLSVQRIVQRWAMAVFYFSTNGESWDENATIQAENAWLSDSHECHWYAASDEENKCNDDEEIIEIHLSNTGLAGTIPPEIFLLESLQRLFLINNDITGTIPFEIGSLTKLERLQITSNFISGTVPSELSRLTNLRVLGLGRNLLTGSLPSGLGNLNALLNLGLEGNGLVGTIPTEYAQMISLEQFSLESNFLHGVIPPQFETLEKLSYFAVEQNNLVGAVPLKMCLSNETLANEVDWVISADCNEVECECCTHCCYNCDGDGGNLVEVTDNPTDSPTLSPTMASTASPTLSPTLYPTTNMTETPTTDVTTGSTSNPTVTPTIAPTMGPTAARLPLTKAPTPGPSSMFDVIRPALDNVETPSTPCKSDILLNSTCYQRLGEGISVNFENCNPTTTDWIGMFSLTFSSFYQVGDQSPNLTDAASWVRLCGNEICEGAMDSGNVVLGSGRLRVPRGQYQLFLIQNMVIRDITYTFNVLNAC